MIRLLAFVALLFVSTPAFADCTGLFNQGQTCGNNTGASHSPGPTYGAGASINAQTGTYSAQQSDCNNKVFLGGNAFYTFTIGAPGGFVYPCQIDVYNSDAYPGSGRGKTLSVSGLSFGNPILYPGQHTSFTLNSGATAWSETSNERNRWKPSQGTSGLAGITFNIDCGVGSDSNDGLAGGSGGAWLTPQHAWVVTGGYVDHTAGGFTQTTWSSTGSTCGVVHMAGPVVGGDGNAQVTWNGNSVTTIVTPDVNNPCISMFDGAVLVIEGMACSDTHLAGCYSAASHAHLFYESVASSCTSGANGVFTTNGGIAEFANAGFSMTCASNAAQFLYVAQNDSFILFDSGSLTTTITNNCAFSSQTVAANLLALISFNGATFSIGANTITGQRFLAQLGGVVNTNGGGANFIPGNSAGTTSCTTSGSSIGICGEYN